MIITPYSDNSKFSSGGVWEPTADNFPALKHFWKCTEAAGSNVSVRDAIGNVHFTAGTLTNPDANSIDATLTGVASAGTFTAIGTTPFILLTVGKFSGSGVLFQDDTDGSTIDLNQAGAKIADDGATYRPSVLTTFNSNSDARGRAIVVTTFGGATGMQQVECDVDGSNTNTQKDISGAAASLPFAGGAGHCTTSVGVTVTAIYGMALFTFAAIPDNYLSAISWMSHQWANGNKWIYPGWRNSA